MKKNETSGRLTCKTITKNGRQCRTRPKAGSDYCSFHLPENQDRIRAGRHLGGQRSGAKLRKQRPQPPHLGTVSLASIADAERILGIVLEQLMVDQEMNPGLSNAVCRIIQTFLQCRETMCLQDLEERLKIIEEAKAKVRSA